MTIKNGSSAYSGYISLLIFFFLIRQAQTALVILLLFDCRVTLTHWIIQLCFDYLVRGIKFQLQLKVSFYDFKNLNNIVWFPLSVITAYSPRSRAKLDH